MDRERLLIKKEQVVLENDSWGLLVPTAYTPEGRFEYNLTLFIREDTQEIVDIFTGSENYAFGVAVDLKAIYLDSTPHLKFDDDNEGVYIRRSTSEQKGT